MNSIERFYATIERKPVDRPASWLGVPERHSLNSLYEHFNVLDMYELKKVLDDDIIPIEMPYHSPTSDAIYAAFDFTKNSCHNLDGRTLTSAGFFEDYDDPERVNDFNWIDPTEYIPVDECISLVNNAPEDKIVLGIIWSAHFQDTCAAFGMETALMNMIANPEMYNAVNDKILEFYLKANIIFYEATKGKLHAVLIGNDMGSQACMMLSPQMVRQFVMPGAKKLIEQAKSYGLKVIYHSCGAISEIIPDLIEAGVDAVHPIQALATGMEPRKLKELYGDKVSFCGGVDTQDLLVNGSVNDIKNKVHELKEIFPTGLIISPSHEAILSDIPPRNIRALFEAIREK